MQQRSATTPNWLPQFCSAPTLFAVTIVAELVALVIVLAPEPHLRPWLPRLGVISVYVQWLALLNTVVLCSLRRPLQGLDVRTGFIIAWCASLLVTALASAVVCEMDQALGLELSVPVGSSLRFVIGNTAICALIAAALLRYLFVLELWRERVQAASKAQVDALQARIRPHFLFNSMNTIASLIRTRPVEAERTVEDLADLFVLELWRERVQAASKAQVDALQARIRPHFLFNSMNTIASLIRTRPVEAERTVEDLADLFRAALGASDAHGTLGEELDLVERYLQIERLRLGDRLRIEMDVAALPRAFPMPRLLLQPLIENAVYHGIQPRADGGVLSMHGRCVADGIEIVIANPLAETSTSTRNGVALANVRARIGYHFGARGELRVESGPENFSVTVFLPQMPIA